MTPPSANESPTKAARLSLAAVAGPAWCWASLLAGDQYVLTQAGLDVPRTRIAVAALPAALVTLALLAVARGRRRAVVSYAVVVVATILWLADLAYFRFFADLPSVPVLLASAQGFQIRASVMALLRLSDLGLALNLVLGAVALAWLAGIAPGRLTAVAERVMVGCTLAVVTVAGIMAWTDKNAVRLDQQFQHRAVAQQWGLLGYHAIDVAASVDRRLAGQRLDPDRRAEVARWFNHTAPRRAAVGPTAGALAGRDLVIVLVESLQGFAADVRINGKPLMPTFDRLRHEGLWFPTVLDQSLEGRTSDTEFMAATSLLPVEHGATVFRFPTNRYTTLAATLRERGYSTLSAVPFAGDFWNRAVVHPVFGFSRSWFAPAFTPGENVGWGLNDRDFLRQAATRLADAPRPYFAFLITLSLHHPFDKFPADLKDESFGELEGPGLGNYLHAMHYFDRALGDFIEILRARGRLDDIALVVMGDHDAGFGSEPAVARLIGANDPVTWVLADRVPLVIWAPGSTLPARTIPNVAGQTDLVPTILPLLGIDPARLPFAGRNLLGRPGRDPVVRLLGEWADDEHVWITTGETPGCYSLASHRVLPDDVCAADSRKAALERQISTNVVDFDLQEASVDTLEAVRNDVGPE